MSVSNCNCQTLDTRNFLIGAVSGAISATITMPLEVVKTRCQSIRRGDYFNHSSISKQPQSLSTSRNVWNSLSRPSMATLSSVNGAAHAQEALASHGVMNNILHQAGSSSTRSFHGEGPLLFSMSKQYSVRNCLRFILATEGSKGLYRGLTPSLCGIVPTTGIYFLAYEGLKGKLKKEHGISGTSNHLISSGIAAFTQHSITNPIWYTKTRLQLDSKLTVSHMFKTTAIRHYWRGVTASYAGIPETMVKWALYEYLRSYMPQRSQYGPDATFQFSFQMFLLCTGSAAVSKFIAASIFYPHEVLRTRLREQRRPVLVDTIKQMWGTGVMYRGLTAHLISKVPNTVVLFLCYEVGKCIIDTQW